MLDATPPSKCPAPQQQELVCEDIAKRLADAEALNEAYKTQDEVNKQIRDSYNDLALKYVILLQMYQRLQAQKPQKPVF